MEHVQLELPDDNEIIPADQQESEEDVQPTKDQSREAVLFNTDWTVETLYRQIEKSNINLDPKFQRREACCLLYTSPSPRDQRGSRMPSSA